MQTDIKTTRKSELIGFKIQQKQHEHRIRNSSAIHTSNKQIRINIGNYCVAKSVNEIPHF